MNTKLIEIFYPKEIAAEIKMTLEASKITIFLEEKIDTTIFHIKFFTSNPDINQILDIFEKRFSNKRNFQIAILPVDAMIPRLEEQLEEQPATENKKKLFRIGKNSFTNIHREELYQKVNLHSEFSIKKGILFGLATIVAAMGFIYDNTTLLIASMVIAPFLMPNIGIALGTTLGDMALMKKSFKNLLYGISITLGLSLLIGITYPHGSLLSSYAYINLSMVLISLITGVVAILYLLDNDDSGLIGVMVAISLLPPLTLSGILRGSGDLIGGFKAITIFLTNIVSLNLAGTVTFNLAEIHPNKRREAKKAQKEVKKSLWIRGITLIVLSILIFILNTIPTITL